MGILVAVFAGSIGKMIFPVGARRGFFFPMAILAGYGCVRAL